MKNQYRSCCNGICDTDPELPIGMLIDGQFTTSSYFGGRSLAAKLKYCRIIKYHYCDFITAMFMVFDKKCLNRNRSDQNTS